MIRTFVFVAILSLACSVEAHAYCWGPSIRVVNDMTVDGQITVNSGAPCSIRMRASAGPTYSSHIVQQPSHGSASVDGHRVIYRSRPGYVGNDTFTYARRGESTRGNAVARTVRVSVTVTP